MTVTRRTALRAGCALLAGCLAGAVPLAEAHSPPPLAARLVHVEVVDRSNGATLPVYEHAGRLHIAGEPGREYAIRIRNLTGGRVLAVTSVDGVNVITGDTASPGQSGYVLDPHGSLEIAGWRKSLSRTAAFFFSDHANSYASRTGRPLDVGVIGVAAFAERARPPVRIGAAAPFAGRQASAEAKAEPSADAQPPASAPAESRRDEADVRERSAAAPQPMAKLGTGHGRSETSYARQVTFERSTSDPLQVVALHYDRYENLAALGIVPASHDHYARRTPQPFPGMRFAADPR
jgi:hypothetical protein